MSLRAATIISVFFLLFLALPGCIGREASLDTPPDWPLLRNGDTWRVSTNDVSVDFTVSNAASPVEWLGPDIIEFESRQDTESTRVLLDARSGLFVGQEVAANREGASVWSGIPGSFVGHADGAGALLHVQWLLFVLADAELPLTIHTGHWPFEIQRTNDGVLVTPMVRISMEDGPPSSNELWPLSRLFVDLDADTWGMFKFKARSTPMSDPEATFSRISVGNGQEHHFKPSPPASYREAPPLAAAQSGYGQLVEVVPSTFAAEDALRALAESDGWPGVDQIRDYWFVEAGFRIQDRAVDATVTPPAVREAEESWAFTICHPEKGGLHATVHRPLTLPTGDRIEGPEPVQINCDYSRVAQPALPVHEVVSSLLPMWNIRQLNLSLVPYGPVPIPGLTEEVVDEAVEFRRPDGSAFPRHRYTLQWMATTKEEALTAVPTIGRSTMSLDSLDIKLLVRQ